MNRGNLRFYTYELAEHPTLFLHEGLLAAAGT